jgi:hypothetical protein
MQAALRTQTTVLPGHRIEIYAPELPEGRAVEVIIVLPAAPAARQGILDFLDALPSGPRSGSTWQEVEEQFQQERDAWER